jgi:hypothetical protein
MSETTKRPTVKIRFKGGKPGKVSGAMASATRDHGQFRYKFEGAGPFEVAEEDFRLYLGPLDIFELAPATPAGGKQQQGQQSGGEQK